MLAAGGFLLGAVLALLLGKGISRPMIEMCKAMRELAGGNFDVVLPGLGRRDELGEMAGAVEEFKMQAIAKAERDAAAQEAQNKAAERGAAQPNSFASPIEFEAAVGAIVSNVSASAVQLEQAAGTLTRTAETTQSLSSQVAGASEEASSNMQSVATATEELSTSVDEIGRRVRESNRIAEAAVRPGAADRRPDRQIVARRAGDRRRRQADHGDRRADQSAGAERDHRGRARRRRRPRFRGRRLRGQIAGQPDREGDRRDIDPHRGHAGRDAGIGRRHQGDRRHHRPDLRASPRRSPAPSSSRARRRRRSRATFRTSRKAPSEAATNIMQVNRGATETGSASEEVLNSAQEPVERKRAAARGARPLHGEYQGGLGREPANLERTVDVRFGVRGGLKSGAAPRPKSAQPRTSWTM